MGLLLILAFVLEWFYPTLFEAFRHGQTPGKKAMGIVVVHANGSPLSFNGSLIRNLLRTADAFPLFYLLGFVCTLISPVISGLVTWPPIHWLSTWKRHPQSASRAVAKARPRTGR